MVGLRIDRRDLVRVRYEHWESGHRPAVRLPRVHVPVLARGDDVEPASAVEGGEHGGGEEAALGAVARALADRLKGRRRRSGVGGIGSGSEDELTIAGPGVD